MSIPALSLTAALSQVAASQTPLRVSASVGVGVVGGYAVRSVVTPWVATAFAGPTATATAPVLAVRF